MHFHPFRPFLSPGLAPMLTLALVLGFGSLVPAVGSADPALYSVSSTDDQLRVVDPVTGATLSSVTITFPGDLVLGSTGLASHPDTGELFALLKRSMLASSDRELVVIDPDTGVATSVGSTGDSFAGLVFRSDGTLFAVTVDAGLTPETLFVLNTSTGAPTNLCRLGAGDDGEALAFNPADGFLYHASGQNNLVFERIDDATVDPCGTTEIQLSGLSPSKVKALVYSEANGAFLWIQGAGELYNVTMDGAASFVATMDHSAREVAFQAEPQVDPDPDPDPAPAATMGNQLCYKVKRMGHKFRMYDVDLHDGFGMRTMKLKGPYRYCEPAGMSYVDPETGEIKTSQAIGRPTTCYKVKRERGQPRFEEVGVAVSNEFEDGREMIVKKPRWICLPSENLGVFALDHDDDDDD